MQTGGREVRSMGEVSLDILAFMSVWMKAVVVRLRNGIDLVERRKVLSIVKMRCEERMARVFIERKRRGCGDSNANDGEETKREELPIKNFPAKIIYLPPRLSARRPTASTDLKLANKAFIKRKTAQIELVVCHSSKSYYAYRSTCHPQDKQ